MRRLSHTNFHTENPIPYQPNEWSFFYFCFVQIISVFYWSYCSETKMSHNINVTFIMQTTLFVQRRISFYTFAWTFDIDWSIWRAFTNTLKLCKQIEGKRLSSDMVKYSHHILLCILHTSQQEVENWLMAFLSFMYHSWVLYMTKRFLS